MSHDISDGGINKRRAPSASYAGVAVAVAQAGAEAGAAGAEGL